MHRYRRIACILCALLFAATFSYAAGSNKLDKELQKRSQDTNSRGKKIRVIIQHYTPVGSTDVDKVEKSHKGKVLKQLSGIRGVAAEVDADELVGLSNEPNIADVSLDDTVVGAGAGLPRVVTGAADVAAGYKDTGDGIGVAVIDSGFADRPDLHDNVKKVVDFVEDGRTTMVDPFGHGTHVAGIIGGLGRSAM